MIGPCLAFAPPEAGWEKAYRLANGLVSMSVVVLWCQSPVRIGDRQLPPGAFLVPLAGRADGPPSSIIRAACQSSGLQVVEGEPGSTVVAYPLPAARVAIYADAGAPFAHLGALAAQGIFPEPITAVRIRRGDLRHYDVLVVPGGGIHGMPGQLAPLGAEGARAVADFVASGGGYLSSCAGSYLAAALPPTEVPLVGAAQPLMSLVAARPINGPGEGPSGFCSPGIGEIRLRVDRAHPVMLGLPEEFPCSHYNGPFFLTDRGLLPDRPPPEVLARVVGAGDAFTPGEAFFGRPLGGDGLLQRAVASGAAAVVAGYLGKGAAVLAGSHPEFGLDPVTMAEPGPAARLLSNAVWWLTLVGRGNGRRPEPAPAMASASLWTIPAGPGDDLPESSLREIERLAGQLSVRAGHAPAAPGARAQWGMSAAEAWDRSLAELRRRAGDLRDRWREFNDVAMALAREVQAIPRGWEDAREALETAWAAIGYVRAGEWDQDLGYRGFLPLLELCRAQLAEALSLAGRADSGSRPYDLVARSYLSAVGVMVAAQTLLSAETWRLTVARARLTWLTEGTTG